MGADEADARVGIAGFDGLGAFLTSLFREGVLVCRTNSS